MSTDREIEKVLADLQAAIAEASGQIGDIGLKISEVEVDIKTTLHRRGGAEFDLKVVEFGGGVASEHVRTVSVIFAPEEAVPAAGFEQEIVGALKVIETAISSLEQRFSLSSAVAEIAFTTTVDGKISLVVGGEASRAETHTAKLKLTPI
jgi:hypothetical protein